MSRVSVQCYQYTVQARYINYILSMLCCMLNALYKEFPQISFISFDLVLLLCFFCVYLQYLLIESTHIFNSFIQNNLFLPRLPPLPFTIWFHSITTLEILSSSILLRLLYHINLFSSVNSTMCFPFPLYVRLYYH